MSTCLFVFGESRSLSSWRCASADFIINKPAKVFPHSGIRLSQDDRLSVERSIDGQDAIKVINLVLKQL